MSMKMLYEILMATGATLYMVVASTLLAVLLGMPLGTLLFVTNKLKPNTLLNKVCAGFINIARSIPFIILLVALIPFTRFIVGSSIGIHAAMVPLTIGAAPFFARLVDNIYQSLSEGLIEAGLSMGASTWQMITRVLVPEALPQIIQATTVTAITLVNYSAMAGTVGGGGLGDLAIRYGYQRFNLPVMLATVSILVVIVQLFQVLGDRVAKRLEHH